MLESLARSDPRMLLAIYVGTVVLAVALILGIARLLRQPSTPLAGSGTYESGAPAGQAMTLPVPAAYFQIAALFVIFDFEAAVLYAWAMAVRPAGLAGLVSAGIFIAVLLVALFYLWADGALDTGPNRAGRG